MENMERPLDIFEFSHSADTLTDQDSVTDGLVTPAQIHKSFWSYVLLVVVWSAIVVPSGMARAPEWNLESHAITSNSLI